MSWPVYLWGIEPFPLLFISSFPVFSPFLLGVFRHEKDEDEQEEEGRQDGKR